MQERTEENGEKTNETKKPQVSEDPGRTPGSAEGERRQIEEALGERPKK